MYTYHSLKLSLDFLNVDSNGYITTLKNENLPLCMLRGSYKEAIAKSDEQIASNHFNRI